MQGFKGDKGDPGNSFAPMIGNVETLEPQQPATASTTIDAEGNIIYFNFGIPKGVKGDRGDTNLVSFEIVNGELIAHDDKGNTINLGMVTFNTRGVYDSTADYGKNDIVLYNNSTYMAIKASNNVLPTNTEYWQFIGGGITRESSITVYENVAAMKDDTTLVSGSTIKTLGYDSINDGGGARYIVSSTSSSTNYQEELDNGLYAICLNNFDNNYYDEITYKKSRAHDTDYYITYIPKLDSNGDIIMPYVAYNDGLSPAQYARANYTTFSSNCTLGIRNFGMPSVVSNGEIIRKDDMKGEGVPASYVYLGIKQNRELADYKVNDYTAQEMIDDGCVQVFHTFYKLIENSTACDLTTADQAEPDLVYVTHPRQAIGVKADGTIVFLTCDGRTEESVGLTSPQMQDILLQENCVNAWNLDGGGSSSTTIKGSKLNRNIDDNGIGDRTNTYSLNVKKQIKNISLAKAFSKIGEEKQNIIEQIIPLFQASNLSVIPTNINNQDLNDLKGKIIFGIGTNLTSGPNSRTFGYLINIPHSSSDLKTLYNTQLFMYRDYSEMYIRTQVNGTWGLWERLSGATMVDIIPANKTYNIMAADNTYQDVKIRSMKGSSDSQSIITFDATTKDSNSNYTSFKINKSGWACIRVNLIYQSATAGKKYIKLTQNGSTIADLLVRKDMGAEEGPIMLEGIINSDPNKTYQIQIYGKQNDKIDGGSVVVQLL